MRQVGQCGSDGWWRRQPRRLFAITFDTALSREDYRSWRTAARNLVDHKRRECRWWREVSMQIWLGADGRLRGVASLDAVTTDEFRDAFRRWPLTLTSVKAGDLDDAVYAAVEPGVVACADGQGGYQAVRVTLKPQTTTARPKPEEPTAPSRVSTSLLIEPMPISSEEVSGRKPPRRQALKRSGRPKPSS
jgi:hypothetical protein